MHVTGAAAQRVHEDEIDEPDDRSFFGLLLQRFGVEVGIVLGEQLQILGILLLRRDGHVVEHFLEFDVLVRTVVLVAGFEDCRLARQQGLDFAARSETEVIENNHVVRIVHRHRQDVAEPLYRHDHIPDHAIPRQELHDLRFDVDCGKIHKRNPTLPGQNRMQNVLGQVSELDQTNAQPPTLRLLIAQGLLELLGRDKSPGNQEITQSRQLGSRGWR